MGGATKKFDHGIGVCVMSVCGGVCVHSKYDYAWKSMQQKHFSVWARR